MPVGFLIGGPVILGVSLYKTGQQGTQQCLQLRKAGPAVAWEAAKLGFSDPETQGRLVVIGGEIFIVGRLGSRANRYGPSQGRLGASEHPMLKRPAPVEPAPPKSLVETPEPLPNSLGEVTKSGARRTATPEELLRAVERAQAEAPKLAPGGGLKVHEGGSKHGHTIAKHVGKTEAELRSRLAAEPRIPRASSFDDLAAADSAVADAMALKKVEIDLWLKGTDPKYSPSCPVDVGRQVGTSIAPGPTVPERLSGVTFVLVRDASMPNGYRILTAYPNK
ncbi:MAG: hypothetical protein KF754_16390 [Planctomycetes bacterium]|nr:hypothetical protein [Planctomycetota bacterium]